MFPGQHFAILTMFFSCEVFLYLTGSWQRNTITSQYMSSIVKTVVTKWPCPLRYMGTKQYLTNPLYPGLFYKHCCHQISQGCHPEKKAASFWTFFKGRSCLTRIQKCWGSFVLSPLGFLFDNIQVEGDRRWRVCYQQGYPRPGVARTVLQAPLRFIN